MFVVAERSIRKGEEVCENYYPHYQYMDTRTRRQWLREHYNFICGCPACAGDYPTHAAALRARSLTASEEAEELAERDLFVGLKERNLAEVTAEAEAALQRTSDLTEPPTWAVCEMSTQYTSLLRMLKGNATGILN